MWPFDSKLHETFPIVNIDGSWCMAHERSKFNNYSCISLKSVQPFRRVSLQFFINTCKIMNHSSLSLLDITYLSPNLPLNSWLTPRVLQKSELKLSKYIDDAFVVPDAKAQLAGKSSLELADASVTMVYKVRMYFSYLCMLIWLRMLIWLHDLIFYVVEFCRLLFCKGVCANLLKKKRIMRHFVRKVCLKKLSLWSLSLLLKKKKE